MSTGSLMRLLVFFDLPVKLKEQRRQAAQFRNYLIKDGFYMIQFSLYGRICGTIANALEHEHKLKNNLPTTGSIRTLMITERQYANIKILLGTKKPKDKKISPGQLTLF